MAKVNQPSPKENIFAGRYGPAQQRADGPRGLSACGFKGLQRVQNCKNNGPSLYQWTGQDLPDLADTRQPSILRLVMRNGPLLPQASGNESLSLVHAMPLSTTMPTMPLEAR